MGCDGGTIPRRDELVRMKKKPEQKDKDAETVAKWQHCAISQEKLRSPIMSCDLGRLYNKEAVIEYLLNKDPACETARHIRNLKDVVELKLTENNGYQQKAAYKGDEYVDRQAAKYICPVVGLEMNGKHKFCFLRECGCVLSERAMKEVKSEVCHKCGKHFTEEDVIVINGSEEEITVLYQKMEERRLKLKSSKKSKKRKTDSSQDISPEDNLKDKKTKITSEPSASSSGSGIKGTNKKISAASTSKPSTKWTLPATAKANYCIAKDPGTSEAYKSLFTTHRSAQNKPQAHWVTHNPLYY